MLQTIIDKVFKTEEGKIVIGQFPNFPLIASITLIIFASLVNDQSLSETFINLGRAFLLVWAYLELTEGVNLFRKILGITGMIYVVCAFGGLV
jgi:hypothetical protein